MPKITVTINTDTQKVVPIKPTEEMCKSGGLFGLYSKGNGTWPQRAAGYYEAMLTAAPEHKGEPLPEIEGLDTAVIKFEFDFANITEREFEALQKAAKEYLKLTRP